MPIPDSSPVLATNSEFLRQLAGAAPNGSNLWITAFAGSPDLTDSRNWFGRHYNAALMSSAVDAWTEQNTYFSVAALKPTADGEIRRRKANFCRLLALVVDDIQIEDVRGQVSYVLATSPGKVQVGIFIDGDDPDAANIGIVDRLVTSMVERGMLRADISGNNAVRYVRLPVGQNQKPREGGPWQHRLERWAPNVRLSLEDAAAAFGLDLDAVRAEAKTPAASSVQVGAQDERLRVLTSNIIRGEGLHDGLNQIAASMVATGMPGGAVVNLLRALMEASLAPKDDRWLARFNDIPRAVSSAQEKFSRPINDEATPQPKLPVLSLAELRAASESVSWSIKHVIPADSIGVIFGASQTFKSFVALDMALHIAHGLPWMGKKTKKGPVLFIAAEGGAGIWRRVQAWHQARKLDPSGIEFYVIPIAVTLNEQASEVVDAVKAVGVAPALIVVDTMSQTNSGEENSSTDIAAYFRELGVQFRSLWHCVVVVVHHNGHSATERPRGSSAITANVDFMLGVFRDEKQMLCTVECHKQKDGDPFEAAMFELTSQVLGKDEDGEDVRSLAARHLNQAAQLLDRLADDQKKGRAGGGLTTFLNVVQTGAKFGEVRLAFYKEVGSESEEAKKKAWNRALRQAEYMGLVEIKNGEFIVVSDTKGVQQ